jgi:hypothetical protein
LAYATGISQSSKEKKLKTKPPPTIEESPKSVVRQPDPLHTLPSASTRSAMANRNNSKQNSSIVKTTPHSSERSVKTTPLQPTPESLRHIVWTTSTEGTLNSLPTTPFLSPSQRFPSPELQTPKLTDRSILCTPSTDGIPDRDQISSLEKIASVRRGGKPTKKKLVQKNKARNSSPKVSFCEDSSSNSNHSTCSLSNLPPKSESQPTSLFSELLSHIPSTSTRKGKMMIPLELDLVLKLIPKVVCYFLWNQTDFCRNLEAPQVILVPVSKR